MTEYQKKAIELHDKGYNCAQAVVCAFKDKTGYSEEVLYKISEGFGAGMGNRKYACGALSGAIMVAGLLESSGDIAKPTKSQTYKIAAEISELFKEKCMAVNCKDIKGVNTGTPTVGCDQCIIFAVEIVESILLENE